MNNRRPKYWYQNWFNTPYYHSLYKHRNEAEARSFIDVLFEYLKPGLDCHVLDLACGRGRHARYLHQKGVEVTGLDLADRNIQFAQKFSGDRLHFKQGNMLEPYGHESFDLILNLFTSFGYFESKDASLKACRMAQLALKRGGRFLIDFLNPAFVKAQMVAEEKLEIDDYRFSIQRYYDEQFIYKDIEVEDQGEKYQFQERVQSLDLMDFQEILSAAGFQIDSVFGNYNLATFAPESSERLILLANS